MIGTEPSTQTVTVGKNEELLRDTLIAAEVNWVSIPPITEPIRAHVRIRHKHQAAPATVKPTADPTTVKVTFETPQRAVTPGQAAVLYAGDQVLAGGWIR